MAVSTFKINEIVSITARLVSKNSSVRSAMERCEESGDVWSVGAREPPFRLDRLLAFLNTVFAWGLPTPPPAARLAHASLDRAQDNGSVPAQLIFIARINANTALVLVPQGDASPPARLPPSLLALQLPCHARPKPLVG